ncbi:transglutaminase domain-containing protein [Paenibacillus antri]|uniref:Transglutaminase domain-containing protein n=1 Tax=Paenibacillus antri TaxID=2582848 RepID=A0A5R9GJL2_9BACL|nr:transglutaminase domain-containing protein [Paenibacillus antri]TLS53704.1 transglutaminase domain-containing protein [Paenibacillus antri]
MTLWRFPAERRPLRPGAAISRWLLADWHDKALQLFLGIFLYQYVVWFDFYWLNETVTVVGRAFVATLLIAWLVPKYVWVRGFLALAACIYLTARVVRPEPVRDVPDHWLGWALGAVEYLLRLTPFLWFALGAWAAYTFVHWYIKSKWRLFSVMSCSVVLFCVVDSFSLFRLWEQVAIMIGCGLMMLVVFHLKQLKERDPDGYDNLVSYPVPITVMIVTIVTASLALGVLAPSIRPIVMDPYTAWKTAQGEVVPAFSSGPGFAALSLGSSASGYSRNDSSLGGAFNFDYTPVFTVDASRRSYWRGETRSLYTGSGWEPSTFTERNNLVPLAMEPDYPVAPAAGGLDTIEVTQTYRILEGKSFPVLFGAPYPQKVEPGVFNGETVSLGRGFWDTDNQTMLWAERDDFPYPLTYSVTSSMPVIDEEKLKTAPPVEPTRELREYLRLPEELPQRIADLAAQVTAEAPSPYEKARALETYLSLTFPYTNEPDLTKRQSADFVDSFLFEVQEGYCDYFSTAMVVMARTLGLPARWVKGYAPGQSSNDVIFEQYLPGEDVDLDGPGTFTVRNSDAHSWAEVYFEGYGWIPFEPTSGFSLPIVQVENEAEVALPEDLPAVEAAAPVAEAESGSGPRGWIVAAIVAAAAAGAVVYFAIRYQWLTLLRTRAFRKSPNYNVKLLADVERLMARFKRKGLSWSEHETFREMTARWKTQHTWLQKDLESLLAAFEKAKYSGARLTEEEYQHAELRIRKLRESL